jgi:hypothetical protein
MQHLKEASDLTSQTPQDEAILQAVDTLVASGLLEQLGPQLGVSGAVITAGIGMYWAYRKQVKSNETAEVKEEDPKTEEVTKDENKDKTA